MQHNHEHSQQMIQAANQAQQAAMQAQQAAQYAASQQNQYQYVPIAGKSKTAAGILGILLGGFGAHHFYLGNTGRGIVYLLFFWTYIPTILGVIEGISYLVKTDVEFAAKYPKR